MTNVAESIARVAGPSGYWLQLDVDVLDPAWMPAVDSPAAGGLNPDQLIELVSALAPNAAGISITVFDPDLDPRGEHAALLVEILASAVVSMGTG